MKAMILAAGRGERLRPLTDVCPKPLITVGDRPLIEHVLDRLAAAGFDAVWINTAWLGDQIEAVLGDGRRWGIIIRYSHEQRQFGRALETGGGIATLVGVLGPEPFLVVNGDVFCDVDFSRARAVAKTLSADGPLAHLVLVDNPDHHRRGDFSLSTTGLIGLTDDASSTAPRHTFSGIGIYHPSLFRRATPGRPMPLLDLLRPEIDRHRIVGSRHDGDWIDVGTADRLARANALFSRRTS